MCCVAPRRKAAEPTSGGADDSRSMVDKIGPAERRSRHRETREGRRGRGRVVSQRLDQNDGRRWQQQLSASRRCRRSVRHRSQTVMACARRGWRKRAVEGRASSSAWSETSKAVNICCCLRHSYSNSLPEKYVAPRGKYWARSSCKRATAVVVVAAAAAAQTTVAVTAHKHEHKRNHRIASRKTTSCCFSASRVAKALLNGF